MAKPSTDDLQTAGERLLVEWGADATAGVEALTALLQRDPAADVAIAHRLGSIASEASARALATLERDAADKRVRREAKRAAYRLQQRGVATSDVAPAEAPASGLLSAPIEGYVSPIDGRGDQLIWLVKPQAGGVMHLFAVINDPEGLREVALHTLTRKTLKSMRDEIEQQHEVRLQTIDWRYADFLIRRGFDWARARDARMSGDYPALRAQFSRHAAPSERPADLVPQIEIAAADEAAALAGSSELLREPELRTWFRPVEEMQPALEEMASVKDSPLVLNESQQQERVEAIILQAVDTLFGGEHRASWARRLTELATYFAAARRRSPAAHALAVARALEQGQPPRDVPFCYHLLRASLAYFFQAAVAREQEREKSSLVLTPQQAVRRRER